MPKLPKDSTVLKNEIMEACITVFNEKGLKFTMDDVAKACHVSKKTMYVIFADKEDMFYKMVDFIFDKIKTAEADVLKDKNLSTADKIKKVLCVLPEGYQEIDFTRLYSLKDKYPAIYAQVEERLETGWESTIALIEQGVKEGVVRRDIKIPIVKMMLEASIEQFFQRDVLVRNRISYNDAISEVVRILTDGVLIREKDK